MASIRAKKRNLRTSLFLGGIGFLACGAPISAAHAENGFEPDVKHMALIIGNSDYDLDGVVRTGPADMPPPGKLKDLKNACRDAQLFKEKLLAARWKPEEITAPPCNLTAGQMRDYITSFRQAVSRASNTVVIFYFSGHGAQFSDQETSHSFLFGAGASLDLNAVATSLRNTPGNTSFLAEETVDLHELISTLGQQVENGVLIILDACRNNALYDQIGNLPDAPRIEPISGNLEEMDGIVIAYSTPSGQYSNDGPGDHSIYTLALSNLLKRDWLLDSVLNKMRGQVARETARAYPNLRNIQRPVTRGRFAGDWCVWACRPPTTNAPVAENERPDLNAEAVRPQSSELRALSDTYPAPPVQRSPAISLLRQAAFQQSQPTPPTASQRLPLPRSITIFDKQSQIRASTPAIEPQVQEKKEGMRFDIFWCDEGVGAEDRSIRATRIAASLAGEASEDGSVKILPERFRTQISSVRVRTLSASSNALSGYRYKDDIVVYDADIKVEPEWAYAISKITSPPLNPVGEGSHSSGYMSIFVCKSPQDYAQTRSKLYLQVPANDQRVPGRLVLRDLSEKVPSLDVVQGIELRADGPPYTEVRYYYPQDRDNAFSTASELETLLKRGVKVKYLSRLAPTTKPGLLEVWLGKLDPKLAVDASGNLMAPATGAE